MHLTTLAATTEKAKTNGVFIFYSRWMTLSTTTLTLRIRKCGCSSAHFVRVLFAILGAPHAMARIGMPPPTFECARSTAQCWHMAINSVHETQGRGREEVGNSQALGDFATLDQSGLLVALDGDEKL